jgi:hypothetical protein
MFTNGAVDSKAPVTVNCSSHWFDAKDGIATVGWYEQGVRFLDYRTPSDIQQVGYYIPANGSTWAAYWSPTDPNGEVATPPTPRHSSRTPRSGLSARC